MAYEIRHKHFTEGPFYRISDLALHAQNANTITPATFVKLDKAGNITREYSSDELQSIRESDRAKFEATHEKRVCNYGVGNLPQNRKEYWVKK